MLGEEERHIRNEMFLTHMKEFASRNKIRIILLSAVLPNAEDLAQWITGDKDSVVKSEWKPSLERLGFLLWNGNRVRLEWKGDDRIFNPNFIEQAPLGFSNRKKLFPHNKKEAIAAAAVRLAEAGTVMIFSARANSIEGLAKSVLLALGEDPKDYPWDNNLWNVFESVCREELESNDIVLKAARKGVICHNNRLPTLVRIAIERLMRTRSPLIVIASSTLGQGVNVGISSIIISTPYYGKNAKISSRDFWNICGRAGRAFSDIEGKILYAIDTTEGKWKKNQALAKKYFGNQQMEKVRSGLLIALNKIYISAQNNKINFSLLIELIANDYEITDNLEVQQQLREYFDYIDDELLAMHENFGASEEDLGWVDDVFRKSLALIQARTEHENEYVSLLKARTKALLRRFPNRSVRKRIIASGIPLSISEAMIDNIERFKTLALSFNPDTDDQIEQICDIVREIEIWSDNHIKKLIKSPPKQGELDNMRRQWICGVSLSTIKEQEPRPLKFRKIIMDLHCQGYYAIFNCSTLN